MCFRMGVCPPSQLRGSKQGALHSKPAGLAASQSAQPHRNGVQQRRRRPRKRVRGAHGATGKGQRAPARQHRPCAPQPWRPPHGALATRAQAAFRQERLELLQDITTLAQDAAMNFGSLNDNLDRLIGLVSGLAVLPLPTAAPACSRPRLPGRGQRTFLCACARMVVSPRARRLSPLPPRGQPGRRWRAQRSASTPQRRLNPSSPEDVRHAYFVFRALRRCSCVCAFGGQTNVGCLGRW